MRPDCPHEVLEQTKRRWVLPGSQKKFRIIGSVDPPAVDLPSSSFGPDPVNIRPHLQEFVHAFEFRCHDFSSGLRPCLFAFQLLKYKEIRAGDIYL